MAKRLGQPIDIATTILYAQRVEIRQLMAGWIQKKLDIADQDKKEATTTTPDMLYTKFKSHYSSKIKELFTDSNMGTRNRANHVQERMDERLEGIKDGLTELAMALKAVATRAD